MDNLIWLPSAAAGGGIRNLETLRQEAGADLDGWIREVAREAGLAAIARATYSAWAHGGLTAPDRVVTAALRVADRARRVGAYRGHDNHHARSVSEARPAVHDVECGVAPISEEDLNRREFLRTSTVIGAAVFGGAHDWSAAKQVRVTSTDVQILVSLTDTYRKLDSSRGGADVRAWATGYYEDTVVPQLQHGLYSTDVGRQLSGAASRLAHLAAWTSYDAGDHARADRYLDDALKHATAAGDDAFAGEVLAGMSHHAIHMRDAGSALQTARAAQQCAARLAIPALLAEGHVMEAHGHALRGDARACARSLHCAEEALDRASANSTPEWLKYFDSTYFSARAAHCFLDLSQWSDCEAQASLALEMNEGLGRARVSNLVVLAHALVDKDVERAAAVGRQGIEAAIQLGSGRTVEYLGDLQRHLNSRHGREPAVRTFNDMLDTFSGGD